MHDPQSVETILARLMPPAISESGQSNIESMLDELAGEAAPVRAAPSPSWGRRALISGIAATGIVAAMVFPRAGQQDSPNPHLTANPPAAAVPEFVLISESDRVESMTDDGWLEDSDGSAMHAVRLLVIEENNLLDEESGIVMQLSEPREEVLLMPVSAF
jgi:hypothetical protein